MPSRPTVNKTQGYWGTGNMLNYLRGKLIHKPLPEESLIRDYINGHINEMKKSSTLDTIEYVAWEPKTIRVLGLGLPDDCKYDTNRLTIIMNHDRISDISIG